MERILKTSLYKDPSTLDPRKCGDVTSSSIIFLLFRGLTRLQSDHKVVFDLAESVQISSDQKRYVFYLGEHYWSDGRQITALDFENSWKTVLRPDFPSLSAHLFYAIKNAAAAKKGEKGIEKVGVHAEGPKKLIIELEHPVPYFLELVSFCTFFPIPTHCEAAFSLSSKTSLVSSGTFNLVHWQQQNEILLKRNPHSKNPFTVHLDKIQIHLISDPKEAFSLFEKGELDWIGEPFSPLPLNHLPTFSEERKSYSIGGVTLCFFNTQQMPFSNQSLRQAFSYAIHREKLLRTLHAPHISIATGLVPPILKGNRKKEFFSDADVQLAQKHFQNGVKELGKSFKKVRWTLSFEASETGFQIAKSLQEDWGEVFSLRIHLEPLEFKAFYDRLSRREYMLSFTQWMAQYSSPMNLLERLKSPESGKNFSGWSNAEYTRLLERCIKKANASNYLDLVEQAEALLVKQMPIAPLYYFSCSYLKKPYLKNLFFSPIGRVYLEEALLDTKQQADNATSTAEINLTSREEIVR